MTYTFTHCSEKCWLVYVPEPQGILVVDDDPVVRRYILVALHEHGYRTWRRPTARPDSQRF